MGLPYHFFRNFCLSFRALTLRLFVLRIPSTQLRPMSSRLRWQVFHPTIPKVKHGPRSVGRTLLQDKLVRSQR
jgi:hypothetical protein